MPPKKAAMNGGRNGAGGEASLWLRWLFTNAVGEALGLGTTVLIGAGNTVVLALAFLMGLVLGPVLGFAQWLVLRRFVSHAALWMPANAFAWAFGMVVIFAGIDPAISGGFGLRSVAILALTLACAGAVVGAIHGLPLVWLLRSPRMSAATQTLCFSGGIKKRRADPPTVSYLFA